MTRPHGTNTGVYTAGSQFAARVAALRGTGVKPNVAILVADDRDARTGPSEVPGAYTAFFALAVPMRLKFGALGTFDERQLVFPSTTVPLPALSGHDSW